MKMYCITIHDNHLEKIKKIGYIPVGLGQNIKSKEFITDKTLINISDKNPFYGEYTFHYWLWKNQINKNYDGWIGFCQYRKFWVEHNLKTQINSIEKLNENILKKIPDYLNDYETLLGDPFFINKFRLSKFFKKNFKKMILNPVFIV